MHTFKKEKIKEVFSELLEGESVFITFRFMIPYRLPLNNGSSFLFDNSSFLICLHREFSHYASQELHESMKVNMSIIEITMKLENNFKIDALKKNIKIKQLELILNESFNNLFLKLNKLITALIIKHGFLNMYELIPKDIIGVPIYSIYRVKNDIYHELHKGLFLLDRYWDMQLYNQKTLKKSEYYNLIHNYDEIYNSPVKQTTLYLRKGQRFYQLGDYNSAIVNYNTSYEIYVRFFVTSYYRKTNEKSIDKIDNLKECKFKNLVENHFQKIISNKLLLNNSGIINDLINKYMEEAYPLRNLIVHEGVEIGVKETSNVIELFDDLIALITNDLKTMKQHNFARYYNYFYILKNQVDIELLKNKYNLF